MTYFCFVESSLVGVQHMQPLEAESVDAARAEAEALMLHHASAYAAHIFAGDEHVLTIRAPEIASA
jgi:hypothetical protein